MALVPTTGLTITIAVPGFTPQGGSAGSTMNFSGASGAEKTTWGALSQMETVLETTPFGVTQRSRVLQGLQDMEPVDVSFYHQSGGGSTVGSQAATSTTADANVSRAFAYAHKNKAVVTTVHNYGNNNLITGKWLVEKRSLDSEVGENVMETVHLVPTTGWTFNA